MQGYHRNGVLLHVFELFQVPTTDFFHPTRTFSLRARAGQGLGAALTDHDRSLEVISLALQPTRFHVLFCSPVVGLSLALQPTRFHVLFCSPVGHWHGAFIADPVPMYIARLPVFVCSVPLQSTTMAKGQSSSKICMMLGGSDNIHHQTAAA